MDFRGTAWSGRNPPSVRTVVAPTSQLRPALGRLGPQRGGYPWLDARSCTHRIFADVDGRCSTGRRTAHRGDPSRRMRSRWGQLELSNPWLAGSAALAAVVRAAVSVAVADTGSSGDEPSET